MICLFSMYRSMVLKLKQEFEFECTKVHMLSTNWQYVQSIIFQALLKCFFFSSLTKEQ